VTTLSAVFAKQVETKAEKFECIAKNLRDKELLDNDFRFSENSQSLECEAVIAELKETIIRDSLDLTLLRGEREDIKASKQLVKENLACVREELTASGYPDVMMKISIYEVSKNLAMKQRKQLKASTIAEGDKKMQAAIIKCVTGPIFSGLFDIVMEGEEEQPLEDKQINYCIRKYVTENNLINTSEFPVTLNRENIEINFDCEDRMKTANEILDQVIKQSYTEFYTSEAQFQCLTKVVRTGKGLDYSAKAFVLSEISLPDDKKNQFRSEFVDHFKALREEMVKCI
jgi:hypothetical protein